MTPFAAIFVPAPLRDIVSDRGWLDAMVDVERALANAEALAGVLPAHVAEAITARCRSELFDPQEIAEQGRLVANPAEPLVRALREAVGGEAADYVHLGATSQDIVDSAAMLVARQALDLIVADLDGLAAACAELADAHRSTPMAARTLLQQAVPTTFGLKVAGWLVAVLEARSRLVDLREHRLAVQLGGAAGTLAVLGQRGPEVLRLFAAELGLREPIAPWHTNRGRLAELGGALTVAAGSAAKIALDVVLLSQTEVGEIAEAGNRGGSSTMPHKRNPVGSTLTLACARLANAQASVLDAGLAQEHERAVGAWQAEWDALSGALAYAGGAVAAMREVVEHVEVDTARMRSNLDVTRGAVMTERLLFLLLPRVGRSSAQEHIERALSEAAESGTTLRDVLRANPSVGLTAEELDDALDPLGYLGSADAFVDRALEAYRCNLGEAA